MSKAGKLCAFAKVLLSSVVSFVGIVGLYVCDFPGSRVAPQDSLTYGHVN